MTDNSSPSQTPTKYKQTDLTQFFRNSVGNSSSMKKTFSTPKLRLKSPKSFSTPTINGIISISSDTDGSDFEDHKVVHPKKKKLLLPKKRKDISRRRKKPVLPFPISDDEDTFSDNVEKSTSMLKLNKPQKSRPSQFIQTHADVEDNDVTIIAESSQFSCESSNDTIILDHSFLNGGEFSTSTDIGEKKNEKKHTMEMVEEEQDSPCKKHKFHIKDDCNYSLDKIRIQTHIDGDKSDIQDVFKSSPVSHKIIRDSESERDTKQQESTPSTSGVQSFRNRIRVSKNLFYSSTPIIKSHKEEIGSTSNVSIDEVNMTSNERLTSMSNINISKTNSDDMGEDHEMNFHYLDCLTELFKSSIENSKLNVLLTEDDIKVMAEFLEMEKNYQYFLIKLFTYLPKWYDSTKVCKQMKLDQRMSNKEIIDMCGYLGRTNFLDTDVKSLEIDELLNMLLQAELKQICAKFKLPKMKNTNKAALIECLKKNCRTQSTLSMSKSTEDLLKDAVRELLGNSIKLRSETRGIFYKTYLLQTFVNIFYLDPQRYFYDITYLKVAYPEYTIEEYSPFFSREQYTRFYEAVLLKKDFMDASDKNNHNTMKDYCDCAFDRLENITTDGKWDRQLPHHLHKFSAEYQYISILKSSVKRLVKFFESVKKWLEFLIENYPSHHDIGFWYKHLAHIQVRYMKNYEMAAKTVIEAFTFNEKESFFNLVQVQDLSLLAEKIRSTKSFKVGASYCEQLRTMAQPLITSDNFPKKMITQQTNRRETPGKRTYSFVDGNNETNVGSVEAVTLHHYRKEENFEGIHCEGRLIAILFILLFWDIIYESSVPTIFISQFQSAPLDMFSSCFYKNRKHKIDSRLKDIGEHWSQVELDAVLEENWNSHSHEESIMKLNSLTSDVNEILAMFHCIERKVLSKIFERLVSHYKRFHSGLPDLFLWNSQLSKCKFVEVKGENDKLSQTQILWIQYLIDIGADVEVCHVSGVGARKLKKEKNSTEDI